MKSEPKKPLKEMMADCTLATKKDFELENQLLRNIAGTNMELFVLLSEYTIRQPSQFATITLSVRNFRLLQCINDCTFNGYYEVSMSLMRTLYENLLLMQYFLDNEKEAGKWLEGKRLKSSFVRSKVQLNSQSHNHVSKLYVHANRESLIPAIKSVHDNMLSLIACPEYDKEKCEPNLSFAVIYGWLNNLYLQYAFREYLWKNKDWKQRFIELNEIFLRFVDEKMKKTLDAMKYEFADKLPEV